MTSQLFSTRNNPTKAVISGATLAAANKFIDHSDFNVKQAGLQAACSFLSPTISDKVTPLINLKASAAYDALATGALYAGSSTYINVDSRSFLYKFLYSAGSDFAADYAKGYIPKIF